MQALAMIGPAMTAFGSSTALAVASTGLGVVGSLAEMGAARAEAGYRAALLTRQAVLDTRNAEMVQKSGQIQAQDQDFEAASIMADEIATMAGRGFNINSPSYIRRRDQTAALARRDRLRLVTDANNQAASSRNRAATSRLEASQARSAGRNATVSGVLNIGSSLISGARLSSELAARRVQNQSRTIDG